MRKLIVYIIFSISIIIILFPIKTIDINEVKYISIEIRGEVSNEGTIKLPLGSKYEDLEKYIEYTDDADINYYSDLLILSNNQIINIPKKQNDNKISINNANISELANIPGIGKSIAKKIIDYRNEYGSFIKLEDLMNVNGIGPKKYENIEKYICL